MRMLVKVFLIITLIGSIQLINAQDYQYKIPARIENDWDVGSIYDTDIRVDSLFTLMHRVQDKTYNKIHSILVIKNGKLVFEEYFGGHDYSHFTPNLNGRYVDYDANTLHNLHSVTKAFTSILVGIAIDNGFIKNENEFIFSFFPEYSQLKDSLKEKITIEHLLTCTSGLQWNELDVPIVKNPENDMVKLMSKVVGEPVKIDDKVKFVLSKPQIAEPGKKWYYSSGDLLLLSEIIKKSSGLRMDLFAEKYLFEPLKIRKYKMELIDKELLNPWGMLELRPRDLGKLGYLFINNGKFKGKQIISEGWLIKSARKYIDIPFVIGEWGKLSYGYQWIQRTTKINNKSVNYIFRPGWGAQCVAVFAKYNVVFIMTGGYWPSDGPVNQIIDKFILPSIMND